MSLNDLVSFPSSDTDNRYGMAVAVWYCRGNHGLNHNISGQTAEVRMLQEAGVNAFNLSC